MWLSRPITLVPAFKWHDCVHAVMKATRPWSVCASSLLTDTAVLWVLVEHCESSFRSQRNQTKLMEMDKDSQHRPKRGWVWNQFFVLEEHIGPDPQYVGKVRRTSWPAVVSFYCLILSIRVDALVCALWKWAEWALTCMCVSEQDVDRGHTCQAAVVDKKISICL